MSEEVNERVVVKDPRQLRRHFEASFGVAGHAQAGLLGAALESEGHPRVVFMSTELRQPRSGCSGGMQ